LKKKVSFSVHRFNLDCATTFELFLHLEIELKVSVCLRFLMLGCRVLGSFLSIVKGLIPIA